MIAGVRSVVPPYDPVTIYQHERRQGPRVPLLTTDEVAFQGGPNSARNGTGPEHLGKTAASDVERLVEVFVRIGDPAGARPQRLEKRRTGMRLTHEHEKRLRELGLATCGPAKVFHDLLGKQSAEVTKEDEEGWAGRQRVPQGTPWGIRAFDLKCNNGCRNPFVHHILTRVPPRLWISTAPTGFRYDPTSRGPGPHPGRGVPRRRGGRQPVSWERWAGISCSYSL